jgi:hypothetical protein
MPLKDIIALRDKYAAKRDHSCTGANDKRRFKEEVWHLDIVINAHQKYNETL